jgi:peptidoglycan/LPS O-acetylase OafA/YrhL
VSGESTRVAGGLGYHPELDGIRAIAVLLVIIHHVWQPQRFAGFIGVDVFFVLSGYLITTILLAEVDKTGGIAFGRFYIRRLFRLYPALVLLIAVTTLAAPWLSGTVPHHVKNGLVAATYTSNIYMTYTGNWLGPFGHTWSLALEEQYYLIWPLILIIGVRMVGNRVVLGAMLAVAALASSFVNVQHFEYGAASFPPLATIFGLCAGSSLGLLLAATGADWFRAAVSRPWCSLVGLSALAACILAFPFLPTRFDGWYGPVSALGTVLLVGYLVTQPERTQLGTALSVAPAVRIGLISYGVYLWHYPILMLMGTVLNVSSPIAMLFLVLAATLLAAAASYRYVEQPLREYGRHITAYHSPTEKASLWSRGLRR